MYAFSRFLIFRVVLDRLSVFVANASVTSWSFLHAESRDVEEEVLNELLQDEEVLRVGQGN